MGQGRLQPLLLPCCPLKPPQIFLVAGAEPAWGRGRGIVKRMKKEKKGRRMEREKREGEENEPPP